MRKFSIVIVLIFFVFNVYGQVAPNKYYIQFTDKNNSPYSLDHPEEFLTARALARRQAQNIPVVENDLPVNPQYLQGVRDAGAQILNPTRWLNGVTIFTDSDSVLSAIEALPYVKHVVSASGGTPGKKDYFENESIIDTVPGVSGNGRQGRSYDYGMAYNQINQLNGIGLHDMGYRGEGMVIAVLDAGFEDVPTQPLFDSLRANNQILGTKDFVYPGGNVYEGHTHGREVLSCMAANIPGLMIGTAPKASYWLLRSEEGPSENVIEEYNWVSAAEFADSVGADIINSSLGYIWFDDPQFSHPYSDMDGNTCISTIGADIAASKGILVTNSAGNSGNNFNFPWIGAPADGDSVFTIGAVDSLGNRASFSSTGPTYDGRIKPLVMARGVRSAVADGGSGVVFGSGTSFSSPIMAGMAACLWQAHREMNNMEIIEAIKESASNHNFPNNYMGWGIPDFMEANSLLTVIDKSFTGEHLAVVFPNPFNDSFTIKTKKEGDYHFQVTDFTGKVLIDEMKYNINRGRKITFSEITKLPAGIYFLKVSVDRYLQVFKLIKN